MCIVMHVYICTAPSSSFPTPAPLTPQALEGFTEEQLRSKLAQLTTEYMERTQWEGMHIPHSTFYIPIIRYYISTEEV